MKATYLRAPLLTNAAYLVRYSQPQPDLVYMHDPAKKALSGRASVPCV
jgi:hypothetical protein